MNCISMSPVYQFLWNVVYLLRYGNENIPILCFHCLEGGQNRVLLHQAMVKCEVFDSGVTIKGRGLRIAF